MSEQTQAASSPAETVDVFNGENVSMAEFSRYREDGTLPERFKPVDQADSTTADSPEQTVDAAEASDSDPKDAQELPPKTSSAEKRIKQLLAETTELKRKLEAAKPTQTDSSTAQAPVQQPQTYKDWFKAFNASQWVEDYGKKNPQASYETANAAMADFLGDARDHFRGIEQAEQQKLNTLRGKLDEARARYQDADTTIFPAAQAIKDAQIPAAVKQVFADSDHFVDLCYVVGSDPEELKKFISLAQTNPRAAIGKVFDYERGIAEELAKPKETPARGEDGKFTAPETKKTTAPKPPSPVGGGSSRAFDVNDDSLSADEWMRKRNLQVAKG